MLEERPATNMYKYVDNIPICKITKCKHQSRQLALASSLPLEGHIVVE